MHPLEVDNSDDSEVIFASVMRPSICSTWYSGVYSDWAVNGPEPEFRWSQPNLQLVVLHGMVEIISRASTSVTALLECRLQMPGGGRILIHLGRACALFIQSSPLKIATYAPSLCRYIPSVYPCSFQSVLDFRIRMVMLLLNEKIPALASSIMILDLIKKVCRGIP